MSSTNIIYNTHKPDCMNISDYKNLSVYQISFFYIIK